jgi:protoporphyrinogen oxidase
VYDAKRVCIIGGGFTGMAAATELLSRGVSVHLVEKKERLGGMAGGFREAGWRSSLEYTYHHWFSGDRHFRDHAELWGVSGELLLKRPYTLMEKMDGVFARMDSPGSLLRFSDLSMMERLKMGMVLLYLRWTRQWQPLERVTAAEWCRRRMGPKAYESIWRPQLIGKFGPEWEPRISMAFLWARLHVRSPRLGIVQGGFQVMADKAESYLAQRGAIIHKNIQDALVMPGTGGIWQVRINGHWQEFDSVIVAASPLTLRSVASTANPQFCEHICRFPYMGARTIILSLNRPLGNCGAYWYSLTPGEGSPFTVAVEHTSLVPAEEFAGEHIVYLCRYLPPGAPEWQWDQDTLQTKAIASLKRINPHLQSADVNRSWVFDIHYAQPVRGVNASADIPPLAVPGCRDLFFASMAHIYPWDRGTNFALEMGRNVARCCAADLGGAR